MQRARLRRAADRKALAGHVLPCIGAFIYELGLVWLLATARLSFVLFVLRGQLEH